MTAVPARARGSALSLSRMAGWGGLHLPVFCVLYCLITISTFPPVVEVSGAAAAPWLFGAMWRWGLALGGVAALLVFFPRLLLSSLVWRSVRSAPKPWLLALGGLTSLEYVGFALSLRYVDVSVVAVLTEAWPIFFVLVFGLTLRREGAAAAGGLGWLMLLLSIGFAGVGLVVFSQAGDWAGAAASWREIAFGTFLALLTMCSMSCMVFPFLWGREWAVGPGRRLFMGSVGTAGPALGGFTGYRLAFFGVILGFLVAIVPGLVLLPVVAWFVGELALEAVSPRQVAWIGLLMGVVNVTVVLLIRLANLLTDNLGVNGLVFFSPLLSLLILAVFGEVGVASVDYLTAGAALLVVANVLLSFRAGGGVCYQVLALGLSVAGAATVLGLGAWELIVVSPAGGVAGG